MELTVLLLLLQAATALKQSPDLPQHGADFTISRIPRTRKDRPMTPLKITNHVVNLRREISKSLSSIYVQTMRAQAKAALEGTERDSNGTAQLIPVDAGQVFLAPITVGGQNLEVVVDTGSSDPWLIIPNYTCVNPRTGETQPEGNCNFGATYNISQSSTYTQIPNENFNVTYTDKESLNGGMAYESFNLAGITVPQQQFGAVDYAAWYGDGYSSGLVGLAYGTLTSAYKGTDPRLDVSGSTLMYSPLFTNMYNMSLVAPVFSLAIDRDPNNGGVLALGGIPNVPHSPYWVSTPIQSVGVFVGTTTPAYEFYEIQTDGFAYSTSNDTQFNPYPNANTRKRSLVTNGSGIIDSGTSLVYIPNIVADAVAAAFQPPANYDSTTDAYFVSCTAIPPIFGVSIGKKIFYVNGLDMVVPSSEGQCLSSVQPNNGGLTILGDVFLKNVVTVFDIGAEMMRFAAREYYGLTSEVVRPST